MNTFHPFYIHRLRSIMILSWFFCLKIYLDLFICSDNLVVEIFMFLNGQVCANTKKEYFYFLLFCFNDLYLFLYPNCLLMLPIMHCETVVKLGMTLGSSLNQLWKYYYFFLSSYSSSYLPS